MGSDTDKNKQNSATRSLALVTGASRGIGYELAILCAKDGYDLLVAADNNQEGKLTIKGTTHSRWGNRGAGLAYAARNMMKDESEVARDVHIETLISINNC